MTATAETEIDLEELFAPNGQLWKNIRHYARKLVKLKVFPESELEDVEQDLTLRLLRRLKRFQAERSSIGTFIDRAVKFEALEMFRTRCKPTHVRERRMKALSALTVQRGNVETPLSEAITREDQVRGYGRTVQDDIEQLDLRLDMKQALESLPDELRETCRRLMEERRPQLAIMRLPSATRDRLREHFEAKGLGGYL